MPHRQIIEGETFIAVRDLPRRQPITSMCDLNKALAKIPKKRFLAELYQEPLPQTPFQAELERTRTEIQFSKHTDDGTLRLYKPDSLIGDEPAGYSEERVSVKIRVKRPNEEFLVAIKTTRKELDKPGTEEYLAMAAYEWRQ